MEQEKGITVSLTYTTQVLCRGTKFFISTVEIDVYAQLRRTFRLGRNTDFSRCTMSLNALISGIRTTK